MKQALIKHKKSTLLYQNTMYITLKKCKYKYEHHISKTAVPKVQTASKNFFKLTLQFK